MFFGGIAPGQHDLWLPLAPDREHADLKVKGELHLMVNIEDTSTAGAEEAISWVVDAEAILESVAEMPIVVAEAGAVEEAVEEAE